MSKWTKIASTSKGDTYGHVPGHNFHDVDVTIGRSGAKFRVEISERWGSSQGYDQVHGENRVVAIDEDLDIAVRTANSRARTAGICEEYMIQALSTAHAEAVDKIDE